MKNCAKCVGDMMAFVKITPQLRIYPPNRILSSTRRPPYTYEWIQLNRRTQPLIPGSKPSRKISYKYPSNTAIMKLTLSYATMCRFTYVKDVRTKLAGKSWMSDHTKWPLYTYDWGHHYRQRWRWSTLSLTLIETKTHSIDIHHGDQWRSYSQHHIFCVCQQH